MSCFFSYVRADEDTAYRAAALGAFYAEAGQCKGAQPVEISDLVNYN